jgi:hypothetical protein
MERLSPIDIAIIAVYMLLMMGQGVVLARRGLVLLFAGRLLRHPDHGLRPDQETEPQRLHEPVRRAGSFL